MFYFAQSFCEFFIDIWLNLAFYAEKASFVSTSRVVFIKQSIPYVYNFVWRTKCTPKCSAACTLYICYIMHRIPELKGTVPY
jgi:hypothetical protein